MFNAAFCGGFLLNPSQLQDAFALRPSSIIKILKVLTLIYCCEIDIFFRLHRV